MRIVRYRREGGIHWGQVDFGETAFIREGAGSFPGDFFLTDETYALDEVELLVPLVPSKVVAVGLNYSDHAEEMGKKLPDEPMLFMKPSTSIIGPGESIVYPEMAGRVDYEAELGIIIGKTARNVRIEEAHDYILGFTCVNDVTARDLQAKDGQFTRAKGFDTFCPIGPCICTDIDPSDLLVESYLNDKKMQSSRTSNLIFSVEFLVSFVSRVMTMLPGDIISTGTPGGIGSMKPGDEIEVRIEGIGNLVNQVVSYEDILEG